MNTLISHPTLARWDDLPSSAPRLGATDAVVRVDTATPCGTDLHLLKTQAPPVTAGRIFGCEAVGTVVEVGSDVHSVHVGDRRLVSCSSARGHHRSLLHRCRLVAEADGQSSPATATAPGWTRPPDDSARSSAAFPAPPALVRGVAATGAQS